MKNLIILTLFILISTILCGQDSKTTLKTTREDSRITEAELTKEGKEARMVLIAHGLETLCYAVNKTPNGIFISSRTSSNYPIAYLYNSDTDNLQLVEELNGYIVTDYSPLKNTLLLFKNESGRIGSMGREIYTYNIKTKEFKKQLNIEWISHKLRYSKNYDSVKVFVYRKYPNGIGSYPAIKNILLK